MKKQKVAAASHGLTRRALLQSGVGAAALLAAPPTIFAQEKSDITITTYGGGLEKIMREKIVPNFENSRPYRVRLEVTDESDIVSKLLVARNRPTFDAIMVNHETGLLLQSAGLLLDDQTANLPNTKDVYPVARPPAAGVYGTNLYAFELVYASAAFPQAPTSWKDLWNDGVTVGVPYVGQPYGVAFLYLAALLNGGDAKNLGPGFAAIKRLPRFKIYNNAGQGMQLFQQGEISAAFYYSHRAQQMMDMGLPVKRTVPMEGAFGQITGTQIPKSTRNLKGALEWVNFSLSDGFQGPLVELLYSPTNRTVSLPAEKQASFITGEERISALVNPPWADLLPQRDALLEMWRKEIG